MLVAVLTAVAKLVTPTVVPIALMHQNKAIATAATALASNMRGALDLLSARADKRLFPIPLTVPFLLTTAFQASDMRDLRVDSDAMNDKAADTIPVLFPTRMASGKIEGILFLGRYLRG